MITLFSRKTESDLFQPFKKIVEYLSDTHDSSYLSHEPETNLNNMLNESLLNIGNKKEKQTIKEKDENNELKQQFKEQEIKSDKKFEEKLVGNNKEKGQKIVDDNKTIGKKDSKYDLDLDIDTDVHDYLLPSKDDVFIGDEFENEDFEEENDDMLDYDGDDYKFEYDKNDAYYDTSSNKRTNVDNLILDRDSFDL